MYSDLSELLTKIAIKYTNRQALYIRRLFKVDKFNYHDLLQNSLRIGTLLKNLGVEPQDKILIWGPNMPEWVLVLLGALMQKVVVVPVNVHTSLTTVNKYIDQT